MQIEKAHITESAAKQLLSDAVSKVAPLWSLENFVAVNPYLGLSSQRFDEAMNFLQKSGKTKSTLPVSFYLEAIAQGRISSSDLDFAIAKNSFGIQLSASDFIEEVEVDVHRQSEDAVKTIAHVADEVTNKNWSRFVVDRISFWASAYFDEKQANWDTAKISGSLFSSWKKESEVDRSPETMGLKRFRKIVKDLLNDHISAAIWALEILDVPEESMDLYLNALLMKINGWAGLTARLDWDANLAGIKTNHTEELLTIALVWEMALKESLSDSLMDQAWATAKASTQLLAIKPEVNKRFAHQLILQDAFDHANQQAIISKINGQESLPSAAKDPKVQAVFCIDVRSELYRRNLEAANSEVETMGFAGFFAFPIKYVPLAYEHGTNQCPVLLTTSHTIKETSADSILDEAIVERRTLKQHIAKAWGAFKTGAVSCFSFVSPIGLSFLPKLFTDSFGMTRPVAHPKEHGLDKAEVDQLGVRLDAEDLSEAVLGIPVADRIKMGTSALKAMSLTENFAPLVLITGHGSTTVNNPHATGLDCGACGGNSGEANAKVAAAVLNDPAVREGLREAGIEVPSTTRFVAALHDTTTDDVTLYNTKALVSTHQTELQELVYTLKVAGQSARKERAQRMNIKSGDLSKQVMRRSNDWSQVRPEWGLAGCSSFIVAPRHRTSQLDFGAKAFMHSYQWQKDEGFGVLELIMTAPMVVTSWINLQYYASTVDNKKFGSGNKTLHNVVGGMGVQEGFGGDLRTGLPWQSVHDGTKYQHEPQRLNVIIEAPVDEMSKILNKHQGVKDLCDNEWIYLFAMNDQGKVAYKYIGDLEWELV